MLHPLLLSPRVHLLVCVLQAQPPKRCHPLTGHELAATKATLRSIQFTCLFLALKVADRVHALGLLRYILTKISHNQRLVSCCTEPSLY